MLPTSWFVVSIVYVFIIIILPTTIIVYVFIIIIFSVAIIVSFIASITVVSIDWC